MMHTARPNQARAARLTSLDRLLAKIARCESKLRDQIERALCRLPAYLRYRNAALLDLLGVVMAIIQGQNLDCRVTGGLAYDALRGRLTRVHDDIDMMCPASQRPAVLAAFAAAGFVWEDKSPYHAMARTREGLRVDLFTWVAVAGQDAVENIVDGTLVRLPAIFFAARQTARLHGLSLSLPGNDSLKGVLPYVENADDRRFLAGLPGDTPVTSEHRRQLVVRRINLEVHEVAIAPRQDDSQS